MILIRQIEEAVAAAQGLDGRLDADAALIDTPAFAALAVDIPVEHRILGALHHGAQGHPLIGQVAADHVHRPGVGHHEDHGAPGGQLGFDMLPATHLDPPFEEGGAAPGELAKAHEGLEADPDGLEQQPLAPGRIQRGETDLEVGLGDVGLLPGEAQQQGRQGIGQLVSVAGRDPGQQGEQGKRQPATPQTGVQQTQMKGGVKHRILCGHGRHRIIKTDRHFSDPNIFFYPRSPKAGRQVTDQTS